MTWEDPEQDIADALKALIAELANHKPFVLMSPRAARDQLPHDLLILRGPDHRPLVVDFRKSPEDLSWFTDATDKVRTILVTPPKIDYVSPEQYRQLDKLTQDWLLGRRQVSCGHTPDIKQPNRATRRRADRRRQ